MGTCEGGHTQIPLQTWCGEETPALTKLVLHVPLLARLQVQGLCQASAMLEPCLWLGGAHCGDLVVTAFAQLLWSHVCLGHVSMCWFTWKLN